MKQEGFTLIELILIMGLFTVLTGFITINLLKPQITVSIDSALNILSSDIKHQQTKAMSGENGLPEGIFFESTQYTLFKGTSYNPADTSNFVVELDNGTTFENISFPSSQIIFLKKSGEVSGFTTGSNSVVIRHSSGSQKTLSINKYGAIDIN